MRWNSIRTRVLVWWFVTLVVVAGAIIAISVVSNYRIAVDAARQKLLTSALRMERDIRIQIEPGLYAARTLAHTLQVQTDPASKTRLSREQTNAIIRQIVTRTPQILGSCTQWEANAFDGRDAEFANTPMHDHTGKFIPYWFRNRDGIITGEPLHDYENANWWVTPRKTLRESVTEPFTYELEDKDVLLMTFSVPIIQNGVFKGIGSTDVTLNFIQRKIDQLNTFEQGATMVIISSGGRLLAANGHPEYLNRKVADIYPHFSPILTTTPKKDVFTYESRDRLIVVSRMLFGNIDTPWFAAAALPMDRIVASPRKVAIQQAISGLLCIGLGLLFLWVLIGRITRPIGKAASLAHQIRTGDLSQRLNISGSDEIGELGAALDAMADALQKRTAELTDSRLNLAVTLDSIGDAVITTDIDGCVTRMNPVAEKMTGWRATEATGRPLADIYSLIDAKTRTPLENPVKQVLESNEVVGLPENTLLVRPDSNELLVADSAAPIRTASGDTIGVVLVFRDVTEETALQEQFRQSQKLDAIGQLAGGVAHDFNNMLAGIMGGCELLQLRLSHDPKSMSYLNVIMDASQRAADLASRLLAFSRRAAANSTPVEIHKIISDTVALLANTIDKRIEIEVDLSADTSMVVGDNVQLQSVFLNMGINASHAMPDGGVLSFQTKTIELSPEYCASSPFDISPGNYIQIEIRDNGSGISPENLPRIFEPFFTTKEQGKGTGLGLAAVYGTVKQHKGAISVKSEVGKGTRFQLLFPLVSEPSASAALQPMHFIKGEGLILLVDDEVVMRATGEALLQDMGYQVLLAENGEQAVEVFRSKANDICLVIVDMIMPRMNGRECFVALRGIRSDIPIILSSGFSSSEDVADLKKQGLSGFIRKPFRSADLSRMVQRALKPRGAAKE